MEYRQMRVIGLAFAAAAISLGLLGAAGTAQADPPWGHHDGGHHDGGRPGWDHRGHWGDHRWDRDDRGGWGWGGPQVYVQAPPPPVYYAPPPPPPPPVYYAPPPAYYPPPA
jgi:hypothetical protein